MGVEPDAHSRRQKVAQDHLQDAAVEEVLDLGWSIAMLVVIIAMTVVSWLAAASVATA